MKLQNRSEKKNMTKLWVEIAIVNLSFLQYTLQSCITATNFNLIYAHNEQ